MQQSNDQLKAQIEELLRENESIKQQFLELQQENEQLLSENESIKQQFKELQQELDNVATPPPPDYLAVRDSVLKSLTWGVSINGCCWRNILLHFSLSVT